RLGAVDRLDARYAQRAAADRTGPKGDALVKRYVRAWIAAIYLVVAGPVACGLASAAEAPAADLSQYVPSDIGLTVEGRDLHAGRRVAGAGPVWARGQNFPASAGGQAEQGKHVGRFSAELKRHLGIGWNDLRSRLFGRRGVVGFFPPQSGDNTPN